MKEDLIVVAGNPKRRKGYRFTKARRRALKKAQTARWGKRKKRRSRYNPSRRRSHTRRRVHHRRRRKNPEYGGESSEIYDTGTSYSRPHAGRAKRKRGSKMAKKYKFTAARKRALAKARRARRAHLHAKVGKRLKRRRFKKVYLRTTRRVRIPRRRKRVRAMLGGKVVSMRRVSRRRRKNPGFGGLKHGAGKYLSKLAAVGAGYIINRIATNLIDKNIAPKVGFLQDKQWLESLAVTAVLYFAPVKLFMGKKEDVVAGSLLSTALNVLGKYLPANIQGFLGLTSGATQSTGGGGEALPGPSDVSTMAGLRFITHDPLGTIGPSPLEGNPYSGEDYNEPW